MRNVVSESLGHLLSVDQDGLVSFRECSRIISQDTVGIHSRVVWHPEGLKSC